jgi:hypothetical protein
MGCLSQSHTRCLAIRKSLGQSVQVNSSILWPTTRPSTARSKAGIYGETLLAVGCAALFAKRSLCSPDSRSPRKQSNACRACAPERRCATKSGGQEHPARSQARTSERRASTKSARQEHLAGSQADAHARKGAMKSCGRKNPLSSRAEISMRPSSSLPRDVKEHATLSAGAHVDHGVEVENKGEHVNRAADRGCCVSTCWAYLRFIPYAG